MPKQLAEHNLRTLYKEYKIEIDKDTQVDYKTFCKVFNTFGTKVWEKVLYEARDVKLPAGMGYVSVRKRKIQLSKLDKARSDKSNYVKLDWAETKKLGKFVYHLNEHRNGYSYRFNWKRPIIRCVLAYNLRPIRRWKRKLPKILRTMPKIDYFNK